MEKISRKSAIAMGYKFVGTRWLDINKGDEDNPEYRSRLVGKEYNDGFEEGLFASTPPLEALRWLISEAATMREDGKADSWAAGPQGTGSARRSGREGKTDSWAAGPQGTGSARRSGKERTKDEKVILIADVSRAFFEAPMKRKVAVVLPRGIGWRGDQCRHSGCLGDVSIWDQRRSHQFPERGGEAHEESRLHPSEAQCKFVLPSP